MRIFDIVPFRFLIEKLYLLHALRCGYFDLSTQLTVQCNEEGANILMISRLLIIKCLTDNALGDVCCKDVLEPD
jgi:hypothetical protein